MEHTQPVIEIKLSTEEILEQLFSTEKVTYTHKLFPKVVVTYESLSTKDQFTLDQFLQGLKGPQAPALRLYAVEVLSYTIKRYKDKVLSTQKEAREVLSELPVLVTDKMLKVYQEFDKKIRLALTPENVEKVFTPEVDSALASEPPQKG